MGRDGHAAASDEGSAPRSTAASPAAGSVRAVSCSQSPVLPSTAPLLPSASMPMETGSSAQSLVACDPSPASASGSSGGTTWGSCPRAGATSVDGTRSSHHEAAGTGTGVHPALPLSSVSSGSGGIPSSHTSPASRTGLHGDTAASASTSSTGGTDGVGLPLAAHSRAVDSVLAGSTTDGSLLRHAVKSQHLAVHRSGGHFTGAGRPRGSSPMVGCGPLPAKPCGAQGDGATVVGMQRSGSSRPDT